MSVLKYTRKYFLYSLLGLVVICGVGALVYDQIQKSLGSVAVNAIANDVVKRASNNQQRGDVLMSSINYQPPPLGETDDTGYWEGNTWKQKTPPKPKNKWLWEAEMTLDEYFARGASVSDSAFIIQNQPYSEAAIYARMQVAKRDNFYNISGEIESLKASLKYHPLSPALHVRIADRMVSNIVSGNGSAKETVAFGEKALRLLKNSSENPDIYPEFNSPREDAHFSLGIAYQYLGDYDTALYHLKQGQRLFKPSDDEDSLINELRSTGYAKQIALIEAGNPMHKPRPDRSQQPFSLEGGIPLSPMTDTFEQESMPALFDLPSPVQSFDASVSAEPALSARERRAREVAEQAHSAFMREVQNPQRQQQAFDDFLRRMEAAERQELSQVADTFLMREMSKHLQGDKTEFTSQELIRAFSAVRQRQTQGKRGLEKRDAERERENARQQRSQSVPLKPNSMRK